MWDVVEGGIVVAVLCWLICLFEGLGACVSTCPELGGFGRGSGISHFIEIDSCEAATPPALFNLCELELRDGNPEKGSSQHGFQYTA